MKNQETYWTEKRLADLERLRHNLTIYQLHKHFTRTPEQISQAINFLIMNKKLFVSEQTVDGVRIIRYKPWFASGITTQAAENKTEPKPKKRPRKAPPTPFSGTIDG